MGIGTLLAALGILARGLWGRQIWLSSVTASLLAITGVLLALPPAAQPALLLPITASVAVVMILVFHEKL